MDTEMNVKNEDDQNNSKKFRYNLAKTASMVTLWIVCGLFYSTIGVTLVDFQEKLQTTFDQLGIVMVIWSSMVVLGSIVGSLIRDKAGVQPELILAVNGAACSLADYLKPWSPSLPFFGAMNAIEGFTVGCMNTVGNAMLVALWGSRASAPVHAFHFGFGLGAFLGPLLAKDFLSIRCPTLSTNKTSGIRHFANSSEFQMDAPTTIQICANATKDNPIILVPSSLEIPFSIIGTSLLTLSVMFFIYYFLEKCSASFNETYVDESVVIRSGNEHNIVRNHAQPLRFFFPFFIGLFFLYFFINSFEGVLFTYLFTFVFESDIGFDKPEAAYLSSAYFGCYTCSRCAASVIAHFVSVKIMIFVEMIGNFAALAGLLLLGFHYKIAMWAFVCLSAIFVSPLWPSGIAWADRYVIVKAYVVSATDVGAGVCGALFMWLAGHFVELGTISSYLYVALTGSIVALLLLIVMQIMGHRQGDRHYKSGQMSVESRIV